MDSALKQRLLGAAVLIALAIIFVPMFFSNSPPKQDNTTLGLSIPPAPERNFETRNLPVDASPKPASALPKPGSSAADDPNKVTTVTTAAPPTFEAPDQVVATTKPGSGPPPTATGAAAKPVVAPPAPSPPPAPAVQDDGRFVVNLGIYTDAGGAAALVAKVKKLGYPAFAEATQYQGKSAQRVRVGPYADRAAAESVRLKIKQSEEKVPSSIVDLGDSARADSAKPEAAKSDAKNDAGKNDPGKTAKDAVPTLAANRAGGFAVQLGAFKAEEEANKLRDRLRNGGVAAFIEKSKGGEQTLWKVRAGPYADRAGAEAALASAKQKFQLNGMITTQP